MKNGLYYDNLPSIKVTDSLQETQALTPGSLTCKGWTPTFDMDTWLIKCLGMKK